MIDHGVSYGSHEPHYAIIGRLAQASTCDNRDCDNRNAVAYGGMDAGTLLRPEAAEIFKRLDALGRTQRELATALGIEENKISKARKGERRFTASEVLQAQRWLTNLERTGAAEPDEPGGVDYVPVEVLPTYAGMGGGGTGEGDREIALVPRALVVDILRGQPKDFLLINVRGDSMEPDFRHGDQLLVDKRDTSPAQPGPFALWDGEWGEYVVKNVERSRTGEVRIFSTNSKYQTESAPAETTRIIGRPVWFGRRL